jgi:hypothetical protein
MTRYGLLGIAAVVLAVVLTRGAAPPPPATVKTVVEAWYPPPETVLRLARQARTKDRDAALDELIPLLYTGLTRKQVETLIGKPDSVRPDLSENSIRVVIYHCQSKRFPRQDWWQIHYDESQEPHRLVDKMRDSRFNDPVDDR